MASSRKQLTKGGNRTVKQNKIFISWSGENSKKIAKEIKSMLETKVFGGFGLTCFVSDENIASGEDWWNKIHKELKSCKAGIICITKENLTAPWVYYEAGAMVAQSVEAIPLLISCHFKSLTETPFNGKQAVDFYDQGKFIKMLKDIRNTMGFITLSDEQIDILGKEAYRDLKQKLDVVLKTLKDMRVFNEKYVYPASVNAVRRNTVFVSAPMASVDDPGEYYKLHNFLIELKNTLLKIGLTDVYCPMVDIDNPSKFEGGGKAIKTNFPNLKQADCILVIYPEKLPSSILVECGYGIALTKKMVIFYKEGLPYILENSGNYIQNVVTHKFNTYDEISHVIESNGMGLFEGAEGVATE